MGARVKDSIHVHVEIVKFWYLNSEQGKLKLNISMLGACSQAVDHYIVLINIFIDTGVSLAEPSVKLGDTHLGKLQKKTNVFLLEEGSNKVCGQVRSEH